MVKKVPEVTVRNLVERMFFLEGQRTESAGSRGTLYKELTYV